MRRLLVAILRSLVTVAAVVIGFLGIRSATYQGNVIAGGELDTAVATNQLAREMDAAYATGQDALRAAGPATRSRLLARQLLQRHLERALPATAAVVLNRNNSADRLEAVTALPPGSPLAGTLRGAEPRSCLAVRPAGRKPRTEGGGRPCSPARCASRCPAPRRAFRSWPAAR